MFRHKGKRRTFAHNVKLAAILSLIAGMVNISGVLSLHVLTTNVTGHFAYFAEEILVEHYQSALLFLLYIVFFLLGAFVSNFLIEWITRIRRSVAHALPMLLEIVSLCFVALLADGSAAPKPQGQWLACTLLFAMGIQNSLVTQVSQATVRTTHLTGLFTDLGIELSQLFFYRQPEAVRKLTSSIFLRLIIIGFFFMGCVVGGFLFKYYAMRALLFAAAFLIIALLYDNVRYRLYFFRRRLRTHLG